MNALHWAAGVDQEILAKCSNAEKIKLSCQGATVLTPALVGLISMTYAISTITENHYFIYGCGILWFFIVLYIDRYIVSTLYKSNHNKNKSAFIVSALSRYILAIFLGIIISHPLVLLIFDGIITENIALNQYNISKTEILGANSVKKDMRDEVQEEIKSKTERKQCLEKLITAERNGYGIELSCGFSSGKPDCGTKCKSLQQLASNLESEITALQDDMNNRIHKYDENSNKKIAFLESNSSSDYLKRVHTLSEMEKETPHISSVKFFLMAFFIIIDCLPITIKLISPPGEYDLYRDKSIIKTDKEIAYDLDVISEVHIKNMPLEVEKEVSLSRTKVARNVVEEQENERKLLYNVLEEMARNASKINDEDEVKFHVNYIINSRHIFDDSLDSIQHKFKEYLTSI